MKKKHIICLSAILIEIVLAVILHEHMNISSFSLIPLGILLTAGSSTPRPNRKPYTIKYDGENGEFVETKRTKSLGDRILDGISSILEAAPVFMPFVFFFPPAVKVAVPIAIVLILFVILMVLASKTAKKNREEERRAQDNELREQQRREEMGKL